MKNLMLILLLMASNTLMAAMPYTIMVLPFYAEQDGQSENSSLQRNYRRVGSLLNNYLINQGKGQFDVVNLSAANLRQKDYDQLAQRFREDSQASVADLNRRYSTDAVYIIWLEATARHEDKLCQVTLTMDGEGYSSDGRALGASISAYSASSTNDCNRSLRKAEKDVSDKIGSFIVDKILKNINQLSGSSSGLYTGNQQFFATVRLDGITEYEPIEVMGKVLNTVRGVLHAKRLGGNLNPNNPQASYEEWRLAYTETDLFRIQANTMKMIREILKSNGKLTLKGIPYRYAPTEIRLLKGFRPGRSTSKEIQFIFDVDRQSNAN